MKLAFYDLRSYMMNIFKKLFKKRFDPILIDLVQYEKDVIYALKRYEEGHTARLLIRPVAPIPNRMNYIWSEEEMEAMRANRDEAQKIYDRIIMWGR